jgi:GTP:adenosylcobinamide-phosphate guanylyltransferase
MSLGRALVLAGARPEPDAAAAYAGVAHNGLIELGGRPLLARVVAALRGAGLETIAVSANEPQVVALAEALGAEVLPAEAGPSLSALRGVERLGPPVLLTTSDHALLQSEWIAQFLADAPAVDVCVLLARREVVEAAAPTTNGPAATCSWCVRSVGWPRSSCGAASKPIASGPGGSSGGSGRSPCCVT